ncbi:hypothetical protein V8G54_001972 [Vigna mungo]|uniref:Uncharacterized protein n=1 Tax=Vigna mungo TaxID=3915 RepID=A0AAQ3P8F0_VIGMU
MDENQEEEEVDPINTGASSTTTSFRPKTEFEIFLVQQMHTLTSNHAIYQFHFDKIDKEIVNIQQKLGIQSLDDDNDDEENENEEDEGETMEEDGEDEDGDVIMLILTII